MYIQRLKTTTVWIKLVQIDINNANITPTDVENRKDFQDKIHNWEVLWIEKRSR